MCERCADDVLLDYRQGRLPAGEAAVLAAHVTVCAACQAALRELDALQALCAGPAPEPSPAVDRRLEETIRSVAARNRRARSKVRTIRLARWAGVAAAIALVVGGSWAWWGGWRTPSTTPAERIVATLTAVQAEVVVRRDGVEQVARAGMALRSRDTLTVPAEGAAILDFNDATRAELGPQTTVALADPAAASDPMLYLHEGFVAVDAAKPAGGQTVRVRTPEAQAEVTGTKFTLGAGDRRTNLRVSEGAVQFKNIRDGVSVEVPAGYRSTVAANIDPKPVPSRSGSVLQIVSSDKRFPDWDRFNQLIGERLVSTRLWRLGFKVEVRHYHELQPADLVGRALVIASLFDYGVGEEALKRAGLADTTVPVICLEPAAYPVLGMTGPQEKTDFGFISGTRAVTIADPNQPLAGGLTGEKSDLFRKIVGWGKPAASAIVVAHQAGKPERGVAFAYESGAKMIDRPAPARRVGLFLDPYALDDKATTAWALADAAVEWCVEP
jgi:hypothetical protein